jgi:hypothetical protein
MWLLCEQAMTNAGILSGGPTGTGLQSSRSLVSVADLLSRPAPVAGPDRSQSDRSFGSTDSMTNLVALRCFSTHIGFICGSVPSRSDHNDGGIEWASLFPG